MKNLFSFLIAAIMLFATTVLPSNADAQIVKQLTIAAADDTLTDVDTAFVALSVDASYRSAEALLTRVSGTAAGTVVLQGLLPDGSNWVEIESYTITNTASQYKLYTLPTNRLHRAYRMRFITSGTTEVVPKVYTLRYTGS